MIKYTTRQLELLNAQVPEDLGKQNFAKQDPSIKEIMNTSKLNIETVVATTCEAFPNIKEGIIRRVWQIYIYTIWDRCEKLELPVPTRFWYSDIEEVMATFNAGNLAFSLDRNIFEIIEHYKIDNSTGLDRKLALSEKLGRYNGNSINEIIKSLAIHEVEHYFQLWNMGSFEYRTLNGGVRYTENPLEFQALRAELWHAKGENYDERFVACLTNILLTIYNTWTSIGVSYTIPNSKSKFEIEYASAIPNFVPGVVALFIHKVICKFCDIRAAI